MGEDIIDLDGWETRSEEYVQDRLPRPAWVLFQYLILFPVWFIIGFTYALLGDFWPVLLAIVIIAAVSSIWGSGTAGLLLLLLLVIGAGLGDNEGGGGNGGGRDWSKRAANYYKWRAWYSK